MNTKKQPLRVDIVVGGNVRRLRTQQQVSQEKLAEALGLTFQQVQKYEKGTNRMGASRLHQIAMFFGVPIATLFEGAEVAATGETIAPFSKETVSLATAFERIAQPEIRQNVRSLVKSLAAA